MPFSIPCFMGVWRAGIPAPNPGVFTSCRRCRSWGRGENVVVAPRPRGCSSSEPHPVRRHATFRPAGTFFAGVTQRALGVLVPGRVRRFGVRDSSATKATCPAQRPVGSSPRIRRVSRPRSCPTAQPAYWEKSLRRRAMWMWHVAPRFFVAMRCRFVSSSGIWGRGGFA